MAKYIYKAKNDKGEIVTGTVQAPNEFEAEKVLLKNKLVAMDITSEKTFNIRSLFKPKVTIKDRALFARQLATMVEAGLTLTKGVSIVAIQARNDNLKRIYHALYRDLEEGFTFSTALSKHPEVFDRVFVSVVKSGETTGNLEVVLKQIAVRLENDNNFVAKIRGAMYYPAFILVALVGISAYMLVAVIPQLETLFKQAGGELPFATRALLVLSAFLSTKWWLVIILLIFMGVGLRYWLISDIGGKTINRWQIQIPGIKTLSIGIYMSRFSRVLEMLIKAGVPLLDALKIASTTMNNQIYEQSIIKMARGVEKGVPLSVHLQKNPFFPTIVGQMVAVGEQTGKLDQVLDKVAVYYEEETEQRIKAISTLVEPVVLVIIGFGVAFLIFAVLLPIYNVAQLQ